jgi:SRSO17 transposase
MTHLTLADLSEQLIPLSCWEQQLDTLLHRLDPLLPRKQVREQAKEYVKGLLSPVQRKNGWQLAEQLGHSNPYRVQHLLDRAIWDPERVRDDVYAIAVEHLGDPEGVLVLDESGFVKKGTHSVGVARQYSGTAGRVENCQIGVFLGYASPKGHLLLDRQLYVPKEWAEDTARRKQAKVPPTLSFATKPALAWQMLERAYASGLPIGFVTGDSVYGRDPQLRQHLQARCQSYVLAIDYDARLSWEQGRIQAKTLAERLLASTWQTLSCGAGSKGERLYDWACLSLDAPEEAGFGLWLLARRSLSDPKQIAYYQVFAPVDTGLETMVQVAGTRWSIEGGFESAKGEVGLDEYEVRSFHGWYRHMSLALWAQAVLTILKNAATPAPEKGGPKPAPPSLQAFKQSRGLWCR